MDIESFDRQYPSPAHAAAADLRDRYAPKTILTKRRTFYQNRSGAITVVVALTVALLGGFVYVIKPNSDRISKYSIYADLPTPTRKAATQALSSASSLAKQDTVVHEAATRRLTASHVHQPGATTAQPSSPGRGSSRWIANPLSGDALAAALIVDKQQTVELNAEQLRLMTVAHEERDPSHQVVGSKLL